MRKMVCPQCKVGAFFVMNGQGERLPVYISDKGEIVPKDGTSSLEGYDQDTVCVATDGGLPHPAGIEAASCFLKGLLAHAGMAGGLKSTSP